MEKEKRVTRQELWMEMEMEMEEHRNTFAQAALEEMTTELAMSSVYCDIESGAEYGERKRGQKLTQIHFQFRCFPFLAHCPFFIQTTTTTPVLFYFFAVPARIKVIANITAPFLQIEYRTLVGQTKINTSLFRPHFCSTRPFGPNNNTDLYTCTEKVF